MTWLSRQLPQSFGVRSARGKGAGRKDLQQQGGGGIPSMKARPPSFCRDAPFPRDAPFHLSDGRSSYRYRKGDLKPIVTADLQKIWQS